MLGLKLGWQAGRVGGKNAREVTVVRMDIKIKQLTLYRDEATDFDCKAKS